MQVAFSDSTHTCIWTHTPEHTPPESLIFFALPVVTIKHSHIAF